MGILLSIQQLQLLVSAVLIDKILIPIIITINLSLKPTQTIYHSFTLECLVIGISADSQLTINYDTGLRAHLNHLGKIGILTGKIGVILQHKNLNLKQNESYKINFWGYLHCLNRV